MATRGHEGQVHLVPGRPSGTAHLVAQRDDGRMQAQLQDGVDPVAGVLLDSVQSQANRLEQALLVGLSVWLVMKARRFLRRLLEPKRRPAG